MPTGRVVVRKTAWLGPHTWLAVAIVLSILIGFVSLLPARGTPGGDIADLGEGLATLGHTAGYAVTAAAFAMSMRVMRVPRLAAIAVILTAYGIALEVAQGLLGSRSFQWSDVIANALGAVIGVSVARWARRTRSG
jgi:VanZ family protein